MTIEKMNKLCGLINRYLSENKVWADVFPLGNGLPVVEVHISWGDWKHEHLKTRWLMQNAGAVYLGGDVTEENGSDTYSAVHRFIVNEGMLEEGANEGTH